MPAGALRRACPQAHEACSERISTAVLKTPRRSEKAPGKATQRQAEPASVPPSLSM